MTNTRESLKHRAAMYGRDCFIEVGMEEICKMAKLIQEQDAYIDKIMLDDSKEQLIQLILL